MVWQVMTHPKSIGSTVADVAERCKRCADAGGINEQSS
jgi:hypothetical protein